MNETDNDQTRSSSLRGRCWDLALHAYGYGWIFEQKSKKLRLKTNLVTFSGLVLPLAVGGLVAAIGLDSPLLKLAIAVAGFLSVGQLIASLWSIIDHWNEKLAHAQESVSGNYRLSRRFEQLGRDPPEDLKIELRLLESQSEERQNLDIRQGISEREKRSGMRAGLRQFQRKCAGCKEVPKSMKASNCDVCGNF